MRVLSAVGMILAIITRHDVPDATYIRLATHYPAVAQVQKLGEGVLIAPQWVLTAAHVASALAPTGSFVDVGGKRYAVAATTIQPTYFEEDAPGRDLALLRLAEPVTDVAPIAPYTGRSEMGMTVVVAGRGQTGDGKTGPTHDDGVMRAATNVVDQVEERIIGFTFDAPPHATESEGISGPGDSGGPAIITEKGKLYTIGVSVANASERGSMCRYDSHEIYARVSAHRDWIAKTMKDAPPSNTGWSAPVWSNTLPDSPLASHAKAWLEALRGDAASMKTFRIAHRSEQFLNSRPEARHAEREAIWLRDFHGAKLEGYATNDRGKLALLLSNEGKWSSVVMEGGEKLEAVFASEILKPTP